MLGFVPHPNLRVLKELEGFDSDDQDVISTMIDAMIVKRRVEGAVAPFDLKQTSG